MKKAFAVLLVLALFTGCTGGENDSTRSQEPAEASYVETPSDLPQGHPDESRTGEPEPTPELEPEPLEQPDVTAEEALSLLIPNEDGVVPIGAPEDLMALAALVNSGDETHCGKVYALQKNISMKGVDFIPIGGYDFPEEPGREAAIRMFGGTFDGGGFIISGLTIRDNGHDEGTGLFGYVGPEAVVKNLHLTGGDITGGNGTGGVAGIVEGELWGCSFNGKVTAGGVWAGGLAGVLRADENGGGVGAVSNCFINADVTGAGFAGGLVGTALDKTVINDSYALGRVTAADPAGLDEAANIGGFAGESVGSISRCFSNIEVYTKVPSIVVGGFIGRSAGEVTACYFNKTATANWKDIGYRTSDTEVDLKPCTVPELVEQSTYEGWNFTDVWEIDGEHNRGLPFLRSAGLK